MRPGGADLCREVQRLGVAQAAPGHGPPCPDFKPFEWLPLESRLDVHAPTKRAYVDKCLDAIGWLPDSVRV